MSRESLDERIYKFEKDGANIAIPIANLSDDTIWHAVNRAFYHVFSNEAGAPVSTKRKKEGFVADDVAAAMVKAQQDKLLAQIVANTWGPSGNRAPRGPSSQRLQTIYNQLLEKDVRAALQKKGYVPVEGKADTWLARNRAGEMVEATLESLKSSYVSDSSPTGPATKEKLQALAQEQYDTEQRAAELRKAQKAHIETVSAATTFDL
jgi:hypothetical protein